MRCKAIILEKADLSSHIQGQGFAAQDVEVEMGHSLPGIRTAVGHYPVAPRQMLCRGDLRNDLKDMRHHLAVFGGYAVAAGDVDLGDHQNVGGGLRMNVPEGEDGFVLVDLGGRDLTGNDPAE